MYKRILTEKETDEMLELAEANINRPEVAVDLALTSLLGYCGLPYTRDMERIRNVINLINEASHKELLDDCKSLCATFRNYDSFSATDAYLVVKDVKKFTMNRNLYRNCLDKICADQLESINLFG